MIKKEELFSFTQTRISKITFPPIFQNFFSPLHVGQKFNFSVRNKTSKAHSIVNSENKRLMKRNCFLCHTKIYPIITFSSNIWELFIPLSNLSKILIFRQITKLPRVTVPSVLKINSQCTGTVFFVTYKLT